MKAVDMIGKRFGRLVVVCRVGTDNQGEAVWECDCDCGNKTKVRRSHLRKGAVRSCGCLMREMVSARMKIARTGGNNKHGGTRTRLYRIWTNMKTRCLNQNNQHFKWYGALGVTICPEWMDFEAFRKWAFDSGYKDTLTIERIDPRGNYCPENCTWIPLSEQRKNQRRSKQWKN